LKFLNSETDSRAAEQECRALMRLRHPSIVSLLDFSLEDKPRWLAMEYIDGSTLQTYLREHEHSSLETVLAILRPILDALAYAHSQGVIHRDLKPANLMVEGDGSGVRIRILDFGIAIVDQYDHEGNLTARGADPLGTLLYMAPEQLTGQLLTPTCDMYAVGLIAWEMLMGRSVFEGKTRSQMMFEKVSRAEGFALEGTSASFPDKLKSFVEACTHREPSARPSAREGMEMLQAL
jgi:serine/threonine protein kinase